MSGALIVLNALAALDGLTDGAALAAVPLVRSGPIPLIPGLIGVNPGLAGPIGGIVPGGIVGVPAKPEYTLDTSGVND